MSASTCIESERLRLERYRFIDFVNEFPSRGWNWEMLSLNPNITWEDIQEDLAAPSFFLGLGENISKSKHYLGDCERKS